MKKLGDRYEFNPDEKPVKIIHDDKTPKLELCAERGGIKNGHGMSCCVCMEKTE